VAVSASTEHTGIVDRQGHRMNADTGGLDPQGLARQAMAAAVRDHGPGILANPKQLGKVLNTLLPTSPHEVSVLVAAAKAGTSSMLGHQIAVVGPDAAVQTISGSLAQSRALEPQVSLWAVGEFARAMGCPVSDWRPAPPPQAGTTPPDPGRLDAHGEARQALATAMRDYGPGILANPSLLGNLFKDLLPDSPREASLLVAASEAGANSMLEQQVAVVGPEAAVRIVAGDLSQSRALDPQASLWAVSEIARAMGCPISEGTTGSPHQMSVTLPLVSPGGATPSPWPSTTPPAMPPPGEAGNPPQPSWAPRQNRTPWVLVALGTVVVLVTGYFGIAATAKLPPFTGTSPVAGCPSGEQFRSGQCTRTTPPPSPSPTPSSSLTQLAKVLPGYITGDSRNTCSGEHSDGYVAANESGEELCDLSANPNGDEDYVLYAGFPTASSATSYFTSLLIGNGMTAGQGDCSSLTLVTASNGSSQYCEGTYTRSAGSGTDFVFSGSPKFNLGNGNPVSGLDACSDATTVDVVGFTDPTYFTVGIAIGCSGDSNADQMINSDFTAGDLFLGS
jgi:hypothetical protein